MIFINPQWQGSGYTDELKYGAELLKIYFADKEKNEIPLSGKDATTIGDIIYFDAISEQTNSFKKAVTDLHPETISTIGGDCGIELIPISYLNQLYNGNICVLWVDAHADLNTPESSPSKTFHGMPLRTLLGDGNLKLKELLFSTIQPAQVCFMGLRDLDKPEQEYITTNNIASYSSCDFSQIRGKLNHYDHVYIHLDLDVLDKSEFAFTMFPTSNGFLVKDVAELIQQVKEAYHVAGFCITESTATSMEQLQPIKLILDEIEL